MGKKGHVSTGIEEGHPFTRLFGTPLSCHLKHSETHELLQACCPPGFRVPESWLGGNSCGYYGDNTHGHSSCFHSQPWWHPGHEVLRPNLPQQHRVFRWPCPLCLLLSGQPVQPQCCLRSDRQPWGYMGQCLYQPTVGTASSCLVRAWVAFLYHRGSVCSPGSILPQPRLFLFLAINPKTHSVFPSHRKEVTTPVLKALVPEPSSPSSGNLPTWHKDTPPQDPHLYETSDSY